MSVSIAPSPFGSLSVSVAETGSTLDVSVLSTSNCVLTMELGVPGPAGAQGPAGEGVPTGGTAGQVLAKVDGVDYNTEWVNVSGDYLPLAGGAMDSGAVVTYSNGSSDSEIGGWGFGVENTADTTQNTYLEYNGLTVQTSGSQMSVSSTGITFPDSTVQTTAFVGGDFRTLTDYDFTNVADTKLSTYGMTVLPNAPDDPNTFDSFVNATEVRQSYNTSEGGTVDGQQIYASYKYDGLTIKRQDWSSEGASLIYGSSLNGYGLKFINFDGSTASSSIQYLKSQIIFGNGSVQTIAFPGFNNAALTGNPTAPTATFGDSDTSIATTAFVQTALAGGTAVAKNIEVYVRNQTGSSVPAGSIVYISGATGNTPVISLAQANNDANSAQTIGFVKTAITNNGFGYVITRGDLENIDTSALTEGVQLYLSPSTAGTWTTTKPYAPDHLVYVGIVIRSHPTQGKILVAVQNGYEVAELHDVSAQTPSNNDLLAYESSTSLWKNKTFSALGLLTSATAASTYQTQAGMSSYLTTATAASTYQTQAGMSSYATLSSPALSGVPIAPTASNGTNTTQIATTAFVTAAVPSFATNIQALSATSKTTAVSPFLSKLAGISTNVWVPGVISLSAVTSGTGSNASSSYTVLSGSLFSPNAGLAGYASRGFTLQFPSNSGSSLYNYGTESGHSVRIYGVSFAVTVAGVKVRGVFGRMGGTLPVPGTLASRGYGWEWDWGTRTMSIIAHNGTSLTTTPVTWNPANGRNYEIMCTSDGAGTISLYIDGTLLGTSSGGPTTSLSSSIVWWQLEIESQATATSQLSVVYQNPKMYTTNG